MRILFVDDRPNEISRQWEESECSLEHEILPLEPFSSIERTIEQVIKYQPDVILIGYGLGSSKPTGSDVIMALRNQSYKGYIIANSGGGTYQFEHDSIPIDANASRTPDGLKNALRSLL